MKAQVFTKLPEDFSSQLDVVACYLHHEGRYLFLQNSEEKTPYELLWGLPGGKVDKGESLEEGLYREILEETGLKIDLSKTKYLGFIGMRTYLDFKMHTYLYDIEEMPDITLSEKEHRDFGWYSQESLFDLPLITGGEKILNYFKNKLLK